ncbi:MAG: flagellar assembly protein FliH [Pseudolabrys sp.]|nr:flagellar assembly protein FliH [Pseudolabrys sp.]MBV9954138.1 flagellar assembly protein FliH [Pseudolabrys sp.]
MAANAKFLFDHDFATGERPTITIAEHDRRRKDAEAVAYRNGFSAAQAQQHAEAEQNIAAALATIGAGMERLGRGLDGVEARLETEAVQVAVAVARKLAAELISRRPADEIVALATECFRHLVATPHISVRVNDGLYEALKGRIEDIARARGFEGRLAITPSADIAPGDCRIEWADGGVVRERAAAEAVIADAVNRYVAARSADAA